MTPITTTTALPTNPISFHRCPKDISIEKSLLNRGAAPLDAARRSLIQFEVDSKVEDDVDGLAVERTRPESPLPDSIGCCLVEAERKGLENLDVLDRSVLVDDAFHDHDAGDPRLACDFRVMRFDTADDDRRLDVATDAERRGLFGR